MREKPEAFFWCSYKRFIQDRAAQRRERERRNSNGSDNGVFMIGMRGMPRQPEASCLMLARKATSQYLPRPVKGKALRTQTGKRSLLLNCKTTRILRAGSESVSPREAQTNKLTGRPREPGSAARRVMISYHRLPCARVTTYPELAPSSSTGANSSKACCLRAEESQQSSIADASF